MTELIILYEKYINGEYDIADVSRILSYAAISDEMDEDIANAEDQIESLRFLSSDGEQREGVIKILLELMDKWISVEKLRNNV